MTTSPTCRESRAASFFDPGLRVGAHGIEHRMKAILGCIGLVGLEPRRRHRLIRPSRQMPSYSASGFASSSRLSEAGGSSSLFPEVLDDDAMQDGTEIIAEAPRVGAGLGERVRQEPGPELLEDLVGEVSIPQLQPAGRARRPHDSDRSVRESSPLRPDPGCRRVIIRGWRPGRPGRSRSTGEGRGA